MSYLQNIQSAVTADTATLYWERGLEDNPYCVHYEVWLSGVQQTEVTKTHVTLEGLQPDTEYTVKIEAVGLVGLNEYGYPDLGFDTGLGFRVGGTEVKVFASETVRFRTAVRKRRVDVTQAPYFAKGDGVSMNTAAIQRAFDDCTAADALYFPAGVYLTGALRLHSDMEIYLDENAVLQGTANPLDYLPKIPSRFEGTEMECYASLLNMGTLDHTAGANCRNVLIHGKGTIASGGQELALAVIQVERERLKDYLEQLGEGIKEYENDHTIPGRARPRLINMSNCSNVRISGLTLQNGASWNVHMIYSDHILTYNCTIRSENVWNGDGWDPDSSEDCTLFGCVFYTGDDSVAVKSGKNPEGNRINRPTRHIRIFDCTCMAGQGITLGSEMSGGIEDVRIWDCDMSNGKYGVEIKGTKKRGGYVRDIHVSDCTLPNIQFHAVGYNDDGEGAPTPPEFSACSFRRIHLLGVCRSLEGEYQDCDSIELAGFDEPGYEIRRIRFEDITMADGGGRISMWRCKDIDFKIQ